MRFLLDVPLSRLSGRIGSDLVRGQLLTPLTRYADGGGEYAIDNGAFSGFNASAFDSLLSRQSASIDRCLFVAVPDVVGNAVQTLAIWQHRRRFVPGGWPLAFVAQNGAESMRLPWDEFAALFIGGRDPWKESRGVEELIATAKILGKHVHVGRVNTPRRFKRFADLGADTCDGSGVSMYDHMLDEIERSIATPDAQHELGIGG
jgi:hypothetical protein